MLLLNELQQEFSYDPDTGLLIFKTTGRIAGFKSISGLTAKSQYVFVHFKGRRYPIHRLAFLFMTGTMPEFVDHIDRNGLNNKWSNLRAITKQLNAVNSDVRVDNVAQLKGVSYRTDPNRFKRWRACVNKDGKQVTVGTYYTALEAGEAYDKAIVELYGEYATTNKGLGLLDKYR